MASIIIKLITKWRSEAENLTALLHNPTTSKPKTKTLNLHQLHAMRWSS